MITTIRSQLKQSTYRYVIFFLVSIIALSVVSSLFIKTERIEHASWALRVNGVAISYQDFSREVAKQTEYFMHIKAQYGQYAELLLQSLGWSIDPKTRALDALIKEELLSQYGEKLGIKIHPEYINKVLNNAQFVKQHLGHIVPSFVFDQTGMLDMNSVKAFLQHNRMTAQQFEHAIERALIQQQTLDFIAQTSYVPLADVCQQAVTQLCGKQFSYITFAFDHFMTEEKKKNVSEEQLKSFYDAQNIQYRKYWVPESRKGEIFTFKPGSYNITLSDQEIQEYYEDNKVKLYVLDPLKVEVQQLFLQQVATETNASIADIENALQQKSSEYEKYWKKVKPFARGEHKGEFEKNAFVLQHEGELSPVFETKDGKTMLRLVKRIPRTYKPLVNVKKEIETTLTAKAFKKSFAKDIKNIIAKDDQAAMAHFITEKSGSKEAVSNIFKDDTLLSQQLFSLKKGHYGFFVDNGIGKAVLLTDVIERHLPDMASIQDVVKNDFYENEASRALQRDFSKAKDMAKIESFESIRSAFNASLSNTGTFGQKDSKKMQELSKKGLPVHEMLTMEKQGSVLSFDSDKNSFLITLETIDTLDEEAFLKAEKEIKERLGSTRARLLLDSVVASLHRNATIETNESILTTNETYSE